MPYLWSLSSNFWWLTLSNAFEKSSKTRPVWLPAMELCIKSSTSVISCVSQYGLLRKPCWRSHSKLYLSMWGTTLVVTICSSPCIESTMRKSHTTITRHLEDKLSRWLWMMCSRKEQTDVNDTGLYLASWVSLSPFLKIGETFASFQSSGVFPCLSDAEKIRVSIGVSGTAISLRNVGDMSSGPVALWGFRLLSSFLHLDALCSLERLDSD